MYDSPSDQIANFRGHYGLTQAEAGLLLGRTAGTVSAWERRETPVDGAALNLVRALSGKPVYQVLHMISRAKTDAETDQRGTEGEFSDWLKNCDAETRTVDLDPKHPEGRFDLQRGAASTRVELATLQRLATQSGTAGGYLVGERNADELLGPLAINSRLTALGAQYEAVDVKEGATGQAVSLADPDVTWLAEDDPLPAASVALAKAGASYSTCGVYLALSRRLVSLAPSAPAAVAAAINRAIGRDLDRVAIVGTGLQEPLGLIHRPTLTLDAGGAFDGDTFRLAIETLEQAGVDSSRIGVIGAPSVKRMISGLTHDGRDFWRTQRGRQTCGGYSALSLNFAPAEELLIGDFSRLQIRHGKLADVRLIDSGAAGRHELYAFVEASVEAPQPDAFLRLTNVSV